MDSEPKTKYNCNASEPSPSEIDSFVRGLSEADKVALLLHLYSGDDPHLSAKLRRRCREACSSLGHITGPRTAGELRAAARRIEEQRRRVAEERANAERHRRREEEARVREQHLSALAKRGEAAWREVEDLIIMRNAPAYDKAAALLADLGELAAEGSERDRFAGRIAELHSRHARKGQFIARLRAAGL